MKNKKFLSPLITLFLLAAVAFLAVQPAAAEEPAPVTLTGVVVSIDEIALSLVLQPEADLPVTVFLPPGFDLTTVSLADRVQVTGTPNEDGSINAAEVLVLAEGVEVIGTVTVIDDLTRSLVLRTAEETLVTVVLPADFDLTTLSLADRIQVTGALNDDGSVTAVNILILYEALEVTGAGTVTAIDPLGGFFSVDILGTAYTFIPPAGFDWTGIQVGDNLDISGMLGEDGFVVLVSLTVTSATDGEGEGPSESHYCTTDEVHPFGARLAATYAVDPALLQGWFCDGFGWGQIMLALQTGQVTGNDPSILLAERQNGSGWGDIWQQLKLIGKDKEAVPPVEFDSDGNGKPDKGRNPHDVVVEEQEGDDLPDEHGKPPDEDGDGKPDHPKPPKKDHKP
jgi:hypothetical protein